MSMVLPAQRYARQLSLPGWGEDGQQRLMRSRVLVVGAGGLGSPALLYLAAAGVGKLGVVDPDRVAISNLQRQVLYNTGDLDRSKTQAAGTRLTALNPGVVVVKHPTALTPANADELIGDYDLVVDGTDNLGSRFTINQTCLRLGRPWVHGAVAGFYGQVTVFAPGRGPCLRCLYAGEEETPSPPAEGVMGPVVGVIGTLQAGEVLKILTGLGEPLIGRMLVYEALPARFTELEIARRSSCPACGGL